MLLFLLAKRRLSFPYSDYSSITLGVLRSLVFVDTTQSINNLISAWDEADNPSA